MNSKIISSTIMLVTILLLAQTVSVVDAHHDTDPRNKAARDTAETNSEPYDNQGNKKEVIEEKREAFEAYKEAFAAWKTAKENYKSAKSSQVQDDIDATKVILDAAKITKDNAYDDYKEALKKKAR
ncbi:hypothetical protein C6990_05135 [Nitrosopumilus sp. b3]|uniref:hypothetical protein n=1 Tax=Nitrosopumilus sp. b3 TaxID=2109909 RepID=UPI0015F7211B|nr:hypothetical protein [Nitrosopumilus sp. b3]KAF6247068.1 hypothetical protein C6990_05135 [Nitrosopumilus sp. b3]